MDIKDFSNKLFVSGKEKGFSDMEVYYVNSESFETTVYEQEIDTYKVNTDIGLSFRGIYNGNMGYSYTEKFEDEDIEFLITMAMQNAKQTESDVQETIFEGSKEYKEIPSMELVDVEVSKKIDDAMNMEKYAIGKDKIHSTEYCLVATSKGIRRIINTRGLDKSEASGVAIAYLSLVAKNGEDVKSGDKFKVATDYNKINFSEVAAAAIEEAVSKLNAKSIESGKYKIIFRHDAAASLLETFASIFSSDAVQKGISLLKDKEGQKIATDKLTIMDDPFCVNAAMNYSFDDEGVATCSKEIIKNGVLKTLLYNLKTAKKDGVMSTGNGFKPSYKSPVTVTPTNMYISPGEKSLEETIKNMDKAIMITSLQGLHSGANAVSGDFSLATNGYLIEDGKIIRPVDQITVAGNFYNILNEIQEVLSDLEFSMPSGTGSYGSPSIVVAEMSISGE